MELGLRILLDQKYEQKPKPFFLSETKFLLHLLQLVFSNPFKNCVFRGKSQIVLSASLSVS